MIKFIGFINDEYCMEYRQIPNTATLIDETTTEKYGFFAGVIGVIFGFLLLLCKQYCLNNGIFPLRRSMIVVGCITGILLLGVHEILHLLPYPSNTIKIIAIHNGKPISFCNAPITKHRFIISSFLPILLGIIPVVIFLILPFEYQVTNTILWTTGTIGLGAAGNDYIETFLIAKTVPANTKIISGEEGFYYF